MKNVKQKTVAALLAMTSGYAFAGAMGPIEVQTGNNAKEGVYFGAGVGASFNNNNITFENIVTSKTVTNHSNTTSALASVFLGYGYTFANSFYLGAEANSYFPHKDIYWYNRPGVSATSFVFKDEFLVNNYINLDLLPGYRINPRLLIYGRAGLSFADITWNQQANILPASSVPPRTPVPSFSDIQSSVGGRFGAGITYELNKHVSTSIDYFYSYFPTYGYYANQYTMQVGLQPSQNYVGISLVYTLYP